MFSHGSLRVYDNFYSKFRRLREVWQLTWPQISMLLCQFCISMTDVWVAGRIGSEVQGSIGIIAQFQMLFMSLVMAASSGVVASVSQSLGAGKVFRARGYVTLVVYGCLLLGMGLAVLGLMFQDAFLYYIQIPEAMYPVARVFMQTYLLSLPGQYMLTIGAAVFRAYKSVYIPLYLAIMVTLINLVCDVGFGLGWFGFPNYGVLGVAWATFGSVALGGLVMFGLVFWKGCIYKHGLEWRWVRVAYRYLFKVAVPVFATAFIWQTGYLVIFVITSTLPFHNINALAGLTAGMRIESLLFLPGIAFSMTAGVLVGYPLGFGKKDEAKEELLTVTLMACVLMSILGLIIWPLRGFIAQLLTSDMVVVQEIISYLTFNIISVPFTVGSIVIAGGLNGAGASIYPMIIFSSATWLIRLPLAWYLGHIVWQSASGVYMSLLVSQVVQSIILLWIVLYCDWTRFSMRKIQKI